MLSFSELQQLILDDQGLPSDLWLKFLSPNTNLTTFSLLKQSYLKGLDLELVDMQKYVGQDATRLSIYAAPVAPGENFRGMEIALLFLKDDAVFTYKGRFLDKIKPDSLTNTSR